MSYPCATQTPEQIEAYYRPLLATGGLVCIRTQHGGHMPTNSYVFELSTGGQRGRVFTSEGSFYAKSGKHCFHPKGQRGLVVPTVEILDWVLAQEDPFHLPQTRGITVDEVRTMMKGG